MELQQMLDVIRNPDNIIRKPNPVLALRENLGAPRHERNVQKRNMHMRNYGANMDAFRLHGLTPKSFNMSKMLERIRELSIAHEVLPVRQNTYHGINIPTWSGGLTGNFKDNIRYDEVPMFADFMNIPVQDIHSLLFGVMSYGQSAKFLQFGWEHLGSGCFSHVYQHKNSDKVFKVCRDGDSTLLWLEFCKVNRGKQGVPNVYAVYKNGEGYVAVLDRLVSGEERNEICEYARFKLAQCIFNNDPLDRRCTSDEIADNAEFIDVLRAFMGWLPISEYNRVDFHSGNAMFNERGEVVITDPLV